ncbi:IclR family transcriptional regulator [Sulfitobacter sp. JB4-11]|uniref:IclR family transcriptional regulator n=1 Tax=Sulfitobacter rhodophyticola TaxID=3238304 RepID=UPI003516B54A
MSAAGKTLALLSFFSASRPEIGLSEFCKLAKRDKATTYRHLQTLEESGFIEQDALTKRYRLGPIVLQLAQTREITVPRKRGTEAPLLALAEATGETSHVSVLSGTTVYALAACESRQHSIRAIVDIQTFPLHATASGLCTLAFGPDTLFDVAVANMEQFTTNTIVTQTELESAVATVRETGFAWSNRSFEDDIQSVSAPLFDQTGAFAGTVTVAAVAARVAPGIAPSIQRYLITASRDITRNWGGSVPQDIEAIWSRTLSNPHMLERAS